MLIVELCNDECCTRQPKKNGGWSLFEPIEDDGVMFSREKGRVVGVRAREIDTWSAMNFCQKRENEVDVDVDRRRGALSLLH